MSENPSIKPFDYQRALSRLEAHYGPYPSLWDGTGFNADFFIAEHTVHLIKSIDELRAETERSSKTMARLTWAIAGMTAILVLLTAVMALPLLRGGT